MKYDIKLEEDEQNHATVECEKKIIRVNPSLNDADKISYLIHEIVHAAFYECCLANALFHGKNEKEKEDLEEVFAEFIHRIVWPSIRSIIK